MLAKHPGLRAHEGEELIVGLRPEALAEPSDEPPTARLSGEVTAAEMLGADRLVHVELPGSPTVSSDLIEDTGAAPAAAGPNGSGTRGTAAVARFDAQGARPEPGERIELAVALDRAHFFDPADGGRI